MVNKENKTEYKKGELERARQEIKELEKYIEDFSAFLPFPLCTVNNLDIIIDINNAFSGFTGYSKTEIVGKKVDTLFADKKTISALPKKILRQEIIKGQEVLLLAKNKEKIASSLSASLRKDEKGKPIGYFLVFSDIRELKRLQEKYPDER